LPVIITRFVAVGVAVVPVAVNVIGLPVKEPEEAVTVFAPAVVPRVRVAEASPVEVVITLVGLSVPPPAVTAKVTVVPETGLPLASVTLTVNGFTSACPALPDWLLPLTIARFVAVGVAVVPVAVNVIGLPDKEPAEAVTVLAPAAPPRVRAVVANPRALEVAVLGFTAPPPAVTANVTVTPETGLPLVSLTLTTSGPANTWPIVPV
jgi:hypothetical protein